MSQFGKFIDKLKLSDGFNMPIRLGIYEIPSNYNLYLKWLFIFM